MALSQSITEPHWRSDGADVEKRNPHRACTNAQTHTITLLGATLARLRSRR